MATTFVEVLLQLRDELGADTLSGGKIYTYEAGTTTPLVTYQALNGTPNTNPVILDSAGMAQIRQTDGVAYKWVVHDSDDNLLWTRDNITVGVSTEAATSTIIVSMTFLGTPEAQGFMGAYNFIDAVLFPIDFEGAVGTVQTDPAAEFIISVRKNGVEVGTVTIGTDGAFAFDTTSHTTVSFANGDELSFIGPDTIGTAANFAVSLAGDLT